MDIRLKGTPGIYLVGFMASGKSTVGRLLAERLGWPFVDVDAEIEERQGVPIATLFAREGELYFREVESAAVRAIAQRVQHGRPVVAALGGGAYANPELRQVLRCAGIAIWLDVPLEVAAERVRHCKDRPLAQDPVRFAALYEERRGAYAEADYHVRLAEESPEEAVAAIFGLGLF